MSDSARHKQWLSIPRPVSDPAMRLFCFPFAAGGASIYREWPEELPADVEMCAVELPGRGDLRGELPLTRMASLVEVTARVLAPRLDRSYALFGHSMGALIVFELARYLAARGRPPALLLAAGRGAPQIPDPGPALYAASEEDLVRELKRLGGTPSKTLDDPARRARLLLLVRADFAVCETYSYRDAPPLACPLVVYGGADDPDWKRQHLDAWRRHTTGPFEVHILPGDHFFLQSSRSELLANLRDQLQHATVSL